MLQPTYIQCLLAKILTCDSSPCLHSKAWYTLAYQALKACSPNWTPSRLILTMPLSDLHPQCEVIAAWLQVSLPRKKHRYQDHVWSYHVVPRASLRIALLIYVSPPLASLVSWVLIYHRCALEAFRHPHHAKLVSRLLSFPPICGPFSWRKNFPLFCSLRMPTLFV